jgi:hypothetical protein
VHADEIIGVVNAYAIPCQAAFEIVQTLDPPAFQPLD